MAKGLADLLDSDIENSRDVLDENSILSSGSEAAGATESKSKAQQAKKTRKRHKVTMPKPKSRVTKTSPVPKTTSKKTAATKRKALEEQVNGQDPLNHDDGSEQEEIQETQPAKPRGRAAVKKAPKQAAQQMDIQDEMEVDQTPAIARSSHAAVRSVKSMPKPISKTGNGIQNKSNKPKVTNLSVAETRQDEIAVSDTEDTMQVAEPARNRNHSRQNSRMRPENGFRRRAGSASDTERGDPNLRRKLGDVTRRFENIDLKYRNLKEVGINEANANMEKLRKQCDATTQASNELIASLRKELSQHAPLAQDSRKLKKQIQTHEAETARLRTVNTELSSSLSTAQNEIKALQAKLAAARSSSAAPESNPSVRPPGSALKANQAARQPLPNGSDGLQIAQMKEELYSDLTGLIIRSVKRAEDGDTYDCIQTGRNGSKFVLLLN